MTRALPAVLLLLAQVDAPTPVPGSLQDVAERLKRTPAKTPSVRIWQESEEVRGIRGHAADVRDLSVEAKLSRIEHVDRPWPHFRQWVTGTVWNSGSQPSCNPTIDVKVLDASGKRVGDDEGHPVKVLRAKDRLPFSFSIPISDPSQGIPVSVQARVSKNDPYYESSCGVFVKPVTEAAPVASAGPASTPTPRATPALARVLTRETPEPMPTESVSEIAARLKRTRRPERARPDFSNVRTADSAFEGKSASLGSLWADVQIHNVQVVSFGSYHQWVVGKIHNEGSSPACNPRLEVRVLDQNGTELADIKDSVQLRIAPKDTAAYELSVPIGDPRLHGVPAAATVRIVSVSPFSSSCGYGAPDAPFVLKTPVPVQPEFFDVHGRSAPMTMPDGSPIPARTPKP